MPRFYLIMLAACALGLLFPCHAQAAGASLGGFLQNRGQLRTLEGVPAEQVQCYAEAGPFGAYFQRDRISYVLQHAERPAHDQERLERLMLSDPSRADSLIEAAEANTRLRMHRVDLVLEGARPGLRAELSAARNRPRLNFYIGRDVAETGLRYHQQLRYRAVWPGIDMVFFWKGDHLKYDFVLGPEAEVSDIRLRIEGADHVHCTGDSLRIETSLGRLEESLPAIYLRGQDGARTRSLQGRFRLESGDRLRYQLEGRNRSGRDPNEQLVIDPKLIWSTYLGGNERETDPKAELFRDGKVFMVGATVSSNFPTTPGALDTSYNRDRDTYIACFSDTGNLLWSTFFGGVGDENGNNIALDDSANVFITGLTESGNLPVANAFRFRISNREDIFLAKFDSSGTRQFATYVGGGSFNNIYGSPNAIVDVNSTAVTVDDSGNVIIGGFARSFAQQADWPTPNGVIQSSFPSSAASSAGIAKFSNSGTFDWGTYYGTDIDLVNGFASLKTSPSGKIGLLISLYGNLNGANGFQTSNPNSTTSFSAAFAEISPQGDSVYYATYLGGSDFDHPGDLYYTSDDEVFIVGHTVSKNFPVTLKANQKSINPIGTSSINQVSGTLRDGFIVKLDTTRDTSYISYFGDNDLDVFKDIYVDDSTGKYIIIGVTENYPATNNALDKQLSGEDGFIAWFTPDHRLISLSYIGGSGDEDVKSLAVAGNKIVVSGATTSRNFPVKNAYQSSLNTSNFLFQSVDAYLYRLENCDTLKPQLNRTDTLDLCQGDTLDFGTTDSFATYEWWRNGASLRTNDTLRATSGGEYWLTVSDTNGCVGISDITTLIERPTPQPQIIASGPTTFCQGDSVRLRVDSGLVRYQWTTNAPGDTTNEVSVRSSGLYLAQVTNRFGCTGLSSPVSVTVNNPVQPLVSASQNNFCDGDSAVLSVATPGNFQSFAWNNGDSSATTSVDSSGGYFLRTVDNNGCAARSSTLNITRFAKPSARITLNGPDTFCQGRTTQLQARGGVFQVWNTNVSNNTLTVDSTGDYFFTAYIPGSPCSTNSDTVSIQVKPFNRPTIQASRSTALCPLDSVTLSVPSGFDTYRWNTGDTTRSIRVNAAGSYFVRVADTSVSCSGNSDTVQVTRRAQLQTLSLSVDDTLLCPGDTARLSAPGGFSAYRWSNGDSTRRIAVTTTDTLSVLGIDQNGCSNPSDTIKVRRSSIGQPRLRTSGPAFICEGDTLRIESRQPYARYRWNTGDTTRSLRVDTSGAFRLTVFNADTCSARSAQLQVTVSDTVDAGLRPITAFAICPGDSAGIIAPGGNFTYQWQGSNITNDTLFTDSAGRYRVTLTDQSNGCISRLGPVQVTINNAPSPAIALRGDSLLCPGDSTVLEVPGGYPNYQWNTGDTARRVTVDTSGRYTATVSNGQGCQGTTRPLQVQVVTPPAATLQSLDADNTICVGDSIVFQAGGGRRNQFLLDTILVPGFRSRYATDTLRAGQKLRAIAIDSNGCRDTSSALQPTVNPRPQVQLTANDTDLKVCPGDSIRFQASGGRFYNFRVNGGTVQFTQADTFGGVFQQGDVIDVEVTTANGCVDSSGKKQVTINNAPSPAIALRGDSLLCPGDSTVLEVPGGYPNYQWNTGDTARRVTVDTSGRYTATVSNGQGCQGTTRPLQVQVVTPPAATLQSLDADNTICVGDSIVFQAGGGRRNQFLLDTILVPGFRSRYATDTLRAGQKLRAIAIDSNGCRDTSSALQPTVNPRPQVQLTANDTDLKVCPGDSIRFQASGGRFYNFRVNGGTVQFTQADTFGGVFQQGDVIDVEVTTANGCVDSSQKRRVGIWPPGPAQLATNDSDNFICPEDRITLRASGGVRYQFLVNGQLRQDSSRDTFRTRLPTGSNQLQLALTDSNGCRDTSGALSVGVFSSPRAVLLTDTPSVCAGDSIGLRFRGGRRFLLLVNEQVIRNQTDSLYRTAQLRPTDALRLIAIDRNGCRDTSGALRDRIDPLPQPGLTSRAGTAFCAGTPVDFRASGGTLYRFRLNGQTVQDDTLRTWAAGRSLQDEDTIAVSVTDRNNCRADTSLTVTVFDRSRVSLSNSLGNQRPCPGDTVVFRASGANRFRFQRNGNTVQQGFIDSLVVADLQTGDVFAVIGEDANGCRDTSASVQIRLRPASSLSVQPAGPLTLCPGDTVRLQGPAQLAGYRWNTGDTTRSIQISRAGNYRLRSPRRGAQCPATSALITVRAQPAPSTAITLPAGRNRFCAGDSLQLRAAAQLAGYRWSTGDTTRSTVVRRGGRISLQVTDAQGCTNQEDTLVAVDSLPQPAISFGNVRPCVGDSLTLTADAGFADYRWSTRDSSRRTFITRRRPVAVAVTDANGCVGVSDTVRPAFRALPRPAIRASGPLNFCQGDSVVLALDSGYTNYRWSTGQTDSAITITATDTVVLSVTQNGCRGSDTAFTVANNSTTVPLEIRGDTNLCPGDTLRLRTARAYSRYRWSTGDTTRTIAVTAPGQIDVLAGLPSCQGRSRRVSVDTVPVGPRPRIAAGSSPDFCAGDTVRLFLTNPQRNFSGLRWNTGLSGDSLAVTAGGSYFLSAAGAQGCRIPSDTLRLRRQSLPRPAIRAADTAFCPGAPLALEIPGSGLSRIRWNTNQQGSRITVAQTGNYFARVRDTLGCEGASDTLEVSRYPAVEPVVRYQQGPEVCAGDTARLFTTQTYASYQWSNGDTTASADYDQDGVRPSVRVTDANGCQGQASAAVTVAILSVEKPEIQALSDTAFCPGDSAWLRAVGATPGAPFRWSNGLQGDTVGIYQPGPVRVRQTNANGCVGVSRPVQLIGREVPEAGFEIEADDPLCEGDTVRLTARAEGPDLRYRWSTGARGRQLERTATDTVALTTTNGVGCQSRSAAFVFRFAPAPARPTVTASDSVLCGPDDSLFFTGAPGFASYRWNTGDTSRRLRVTQAGNYQLTVFNAGGCDNSSRARPVELRPVPQPELVLSRDTPIFCAGDTLRATTGDAFEGYRWSTGDRSASITLSRSTSALSVEVEQETCTGFSDSVEVVFVEAPQVAIEGPSGLDFCAGDSLVLSASGDAAFYRWSTGDSVARIAVREGGPYRLTGFLEGQLRGVVRRCAASDSVAVTRKPRPAPFSMDQRDDSLLAPRQNGYAYRWYRNGERLLGSEEVFVLPRLPGAYRVEVINEAGCSRRAADSVVYTPPAFAAFPNPVRGQLFIEGRVEQAQPVHVELINTSGQLVFEAESRVEAGFYQLVFNLSGLGNGVYQMRVKTADEVYQRKLFLQ